MEEKWYQFWEKEGLFKADPNSKKPSYCLLMPPPNVTGALHLGHAMEHSIMDALARFKRMQGFDVLLLPGVDHAGIQFEGTYIVQWCPKDATAIEDVEMDYEERKEKLYFVKFRVIASNAKQSNSESNPTKIAASPSAPRNDESDEYITVATTRPET